MQKNSNVTGLILLCDFEKAFNYSLSHSFIIKTLKLFNFGESFIKWIKIILTDFYCVINHAGNISERFLLGRGARQGDPISGYIYILIYWKFFNLESKTSLRCKEFNQIEGLNLNFLQYQSIISAIISGAQRLNFNISLSEQHPRPRKPLLLSIFHSAKKGCRRFYDILRSREILNFNCTKIENKWHDELGGITGVRQWDKIRLLSTKIKFHNHLKWLQYRIFHRSLPTNRILSKFIPNKSNLCDFCLLEPETISYFFYKCQVTNIFLQQTQIFLETLNLGFRISEKIILFGNTSQDQSSFSNLMILYMKKHIWLSKQRSTHPII